VAMQDSARPTAVFRPHPAAARRACSRAALRFPVASAAAVACAAAACAPASCCCSDACALAAACRAASLRASSVLRRAAASLSPAAPAASCALSAAAAAAASRSAASLRPRLAASALARPSAARARSSRQAAEGCSDSWPPSDSTRALRSLGGGGVGEGGDVCQQGRLPCSKARTHIQPGLCSDLVMGAQWTVSDRVQHARKAAAP
jgi:hypothetical protein